MRISIKRENNISDLDGPYKVVGVEKGKTILFIDKEGNKYKTERGNLDYKTVKYLSREFSLYIYLDCLEGNNKVRKIVLEL